MEAGAAGFGAVRTAWAALRGAWRWATGVLALPRRVAVLEAKLAGPRPPDVCPACGARASRYVGSERYFVGQVQMIHVWRCSACSVTEQRLDNGNPK